MRKASLIHGERLKRRLFCSTVVLVKCSDPALALDFVRLAGNSLELIALNTPGVSEWLGRCRRSRAPGDRFGSRKLHCRAGLGVHGNEPP